ncbi:nitronate monooxygenase [Pontiella agarivorans]|uniref:Nitronate monooxygenase n=1 Tax=Pontiella agarivorans TaxID=3038953 RepID=A0ABU5MZJ9_9BACT|nr:nitronate monooxygenase [Pontiella agarivorans]MDZ8119615.1 nitronate monooxygenase [Pontiella agarivorans]
MFEKLPQIIQGGMGFGISDWRLARAVSQLGQLGVVSGTALDAVLARSLQDGDPGGEVRRALEHFPFQQVVQRIMDAYFVDGGLKAGVPYKAIPMHTVEGSQMAAELCVVGNFVEVFLAKEGHSKPVGVNYLEKIQLPHLSSIYGAMLAGVSVVIMGAGIPLTVPGVLDDLAMHRSVEYPVAVAGEAGRVEILPVSFDPSSLADGGVKPGMLQRPDFYPIVSTESLASILMKKANGSIEGFIVEGNLAGGHNAPPRGKGPLSDSGEPVYGLRDDAKLAKFRDLSVPFWLAGCRGSAEGLKDALSQGAAGVQVGTAFGLCVESGLMPETRRELVRGALDGTSHVFTDPVASPTGFPFKVADVKGSLSDPEVYEKRRRICDIGFLRSPYRKADGRIGYRCPAEPVKAYVAKGGKVEDTVGRKCLCNALAADIGLPQRLPDGSTEKPLITMGDDLINIGRFCKNGSVDFSAADVIRTILDVS